MAKKLEDVYVDNINVPVVKEGYNHVFAKGGPHQAIVELELLQDFADQAFNGNVRAAEEDLKGANAMVLTLHKRNMLLIILPFDVTPGVIAHECFHLMHAIYDRKGVRFCPESEEAFAHLLDWLVQTSFDLKADLDKLIKKDKKKKKK